MKKNFIFTLVILCGVLMSCSARDGQYYYSRSEKQIVRGAYTQALKNARKAESLFGEEDFQWKEVIVLQGEIFLWQNDEQKALEEFQRIFEMLPEDDDLLLNIVVTCVRTQHVELAKSFCENAILSGKYSEVSKGLLYYYLAELEFGFDVGKCRDLIMESKMCFLKDAANKYDSKAELFLLQVDEFILRLEEKMKNSYVSVSMSKGLEMMNNDSGYILLDVRRLDEFETAHIPGAVLLTNEKITLESAQEILKDKSQRIYVYCRSGRRSKEASQKLCDFGYTNVIEIGGILDYIGPKETGSSE